MVSDSIPNAPTAAVASNPKNFAKKKRANRSAKLKQYKLDARREQWLSQVKNKGRPKEAVSGVESLEHGRGIPAEKLEIKPSIEVEFYGNILSVHHESDSESLPSASPTSHRSSVSGINDYVVNFTSSSSSSSSGFFSGSMSEEDERGVDDDGCLDDWEAIADALAASEDNKQDHTPNSGSKSSHGDLINQSSSWNDISNTAEQGSVGNASQISVVHCHAWKADDAFRPQSLPNLSKSYFVQGGSVWSQKTVVPAPTLCPICYEDLDCTDSSFLPCSCGFRLCLFCHKKILEGDARCPCCRKQYDCCPVEGETMLDGGSLTYCLSRSSSMITRL